MTVIERQQQLIRQISSISDVSLLTMLEDDITFHLQNHNDITDELTPFEFSELRALASEPTDENTVSLEQYRAATQRWRTKL